jgi:hemoglobin-like flavoprotein
MTPEQIGLVQRTFENIKPVSDLAAGLFYTRLFWLQPSLKSIFNLDPVVQRRKFIQMLEAVVCSLDYPGQFTVILSKLGEQHAAFGVTSDNYELAEEALLWMLERCLREEYSQEIETAWKEVYQFSVNIMQKGNAAISGTADMSLLKFI